MRYYKLSVDMERSHDVVCHYNSNLEIRQYIFNMGTYCDREYRNLEFYYDEQEGDVLTDYLANVKGWFIVSGKLQRILRSVNTQIQFLPVRIVEKNRNIILEDYCIANILCVVDALCLEASDYFETEIPEIGVIHTVSKYGIYADKTENADVFKLSNRQEIPVFVSEKFKILIEREDVTGIALREIKVV